MLIALLTLVQAAQGPRPYWQQRISYDITASLDEAAGRLAGRERVVYRNQSPDTLTTLSFHLYLNAFRPGSRWAAADSVEGRRRFNDLRDPDFGMNGVRNVRIMGAPVAAIYPFAPDSTVVRFVLPHPLPPGDSLVADLDWYARPSTTPRRQGRKGRAFDFAQWYPRVVAYDKHGWAEHPLYPAGEFYGDFGDFTVRLDVPEDQVIGATGVPLCGDPGWERANRTPERPVEYRRDAYPAALAALSADACAAAGPGRKTVVWRAEDLHHFAISMRPDYRYEGGQFGRVAVHALYQAGDDAAWGGGIVVKRTETMLEWLDGLFGPYPWPQMTNVHRIEGGGTEFPMMMHNGSPGQELILHEGGHNYLMGILANNEWKEGFLDEGFTSFQTSWWAEEHGARATDPDFERYAALEREMLMMDLDGWSEPTSYQGEQYRDFLTYNTMIYSRGELFFHQLREIVGAPTMREILRTYYARWKLRHVDEEAFRQVAEEVSKRDLSTFFGQWLHGVTRYGWSVGRVRSARETGPDGRPQWRTRVEIRRTEPGVFPVEVVVRSGIDSAVTQIGGLAEREWVELVTAGRPREVMVDPRVRGHDWFMLDNRRRRSWLGWRRGMPGRVSLDRVFSTRTYRDREALELLPTAWYNDAGGVMLGVRLRSNYLGRFDQVDYQHSVALRDVNASGRRAVDHWAFGIRNPHFLAVPRLRTEFSLFHLEGREGASLSFERERKGHLGFGPRTTSGASLRWMATYDGRYLEPGRYDNAGTVEAAWSIRSTERRGPWQVSGRMSLGGGVEYRNRSAGVSTDDRYDAQVYGRVFGEATARRRLPGHRLAGVRVFGGWLEGAGGADPVRQRWFYASGADPYEEMSNPFVRSREALLGGDVHYHTPGGADVRGLARDVAVTRLLAVNGELEQSVWRRPATAVLQDVRVALFADGALSNGFYSVRGGGRVAGDAGLGVRLVHRIGQTTFQTRFDVPVWVSHPDRAVGGAVGDTRTRFRWTVGVGPGF